jgi:hypothetical protein
MVVLAFLAGLSVASRVWLVYPRLEWDLLSGRRWIAAPRSQYFIVLGLTADSQLDPIVYLWDVFAPSTRDDRLTADRSAARNCHPLVVAQLLPLRQLSLGTPHQPQNPLVSITAALPNPPESLSSRNIYEKGIEILDKTYYNFKNATIQSKSQLLLTLA